MNAGALALTVVYAVLAALSIAGLVRNTAVYRFRIRLLDAVSDAARFDIQMGREWMWRYDAMNSAPYNRMVLFAWRPMQSFWSSMDFAEIGAVPVPKLDVT